MYVSADESIRRHLTRMPDISELITCTCMCMSNIYLQSAKHLNPADKTKQSWSAEIRASQQDVQISNVASVTLT